jgi:hypothetical protein
MRANSDRQSSRSLARHQSWMVVVSGDGPGSPGRRTDDTATGRPADERHRVRAEAQRRVLDDERVPAADKRVSLFEPHTAVIRRGKLPVPTEFGTTLLLDERTARILAANTESALSAGFCTAN